MYFERVFVLIVFLLFQLSFSVQTQVTKSKLDGCPQFGHISTDSLFVRWDKPDVPEDSIQKYELSVSEYYEFESKSGIRKVLSSLETEKFVKDLSPSTLYEFTLETIGTSEESLHTCSKTVRMKGTGNLIQNPSFEYTGEPRIPQVDYGKRLFYAYWEPLMMPYEVESNVARTGEKSLHFRSSSVRNKFGASQYIFLNQTERELLSGKSSSLVLSGYSKTLDLTGEKDDGYSMYIDILHQDGSYEYGHTLQFTPGTHNWDYLCLTVEIDKPILSVHIFMIYSGHSGSVWFDDVSLKILSDQTFHECPSHFVPSIFPSCCSDRTSILGDVQPTFYDVSIVSQMTVDRLSILRYMSETWPGPISVSIYVLDYEEDLAKIFSLREQSDSVRRNVDFHLVNGDEGLFAFRTLGLYPVNTLRNDAINKCRTKFAFILDIDFIPNIDAYEEIRKYLPLLENQKVVFVAPALEMDDFSQGLPGTKKELLEFVNKDIARQVHKNKWYPAHGPTNFAHWYRTDELFAIEYERDFEPYVVCPVNVPRWDERFVGYGYDKVSHTTELQYAGYTFYVLPNVFIIHWDHGVPAWRGKGDYVRVRVWQNYYSFLEEINLRYTTSLRIEREKSLPSQQIKDKSNRIIVPLLYLVLVILFANLFGKRLLQLSGGIQNKGDVRKGGKGV